MFTLLHVIPSVLLPVSFQIAPQLLQVYNHTIFFENIHKEEFGKCCTKKSKNRQGQGVHFYSMWRHKFWKFFHSPPTMVAPSTLPKKTLDTSLVGHIHNFDSWRNRYKNLVLIGKNEMIRNILSGAFSFLTSVALFSHFFCLKLFSDVFI